MLFVECEISDFAILVELGFKTWRRTSNRRKITEELPLIFSANSPLFFVRVFGSGAAAGGVLR